MELEHIDKTKNDVISCDDAVRVDNLITTIGRGWG